MSFLLHLPMAQLLVSDSSHAKALRQQPWAVLKNVSKMALWPTNYMNNNAPDSSPITRLPPEILFEIFEQLDPIDSTCLGLASKQFYDIHRSEYGPVPLSCRRVGPNDLEWAWRNSTTSPSPASRWKLDKYRGIPLKRIALHYTPSALSWWGQGRAYCHQCGEERCELHRHLRNWMAAEQGLLEYCSVTERFGPPADKAAPDFCHLRSPRRLRRCGRHYKGKVDEKDELSAGIPPVSMFAEIKAY